MPLSWAMLLEKMVWAGIAALGFAILFNVPIRTLVGCAICGAVAFCARALLTQVDQIGIEAATLTGAILVAFLGVAFARRWHVPAPVFIVPGVIPLVPGSLAFRAMIGVLTLAASDATVDMTQLAETTVNTIRTMLIVGAIAGGIAMPRLLLRRHRPMT